VSILHRAAFTVSAAQLDQLLAPTAPEVCFVGRSNVGKSSAINVLSNQKRLAFSSKTPGRTRLINLFGIPDPLSSRPARCIHPAQSVTIRTFYGSESYGLA